MFQHRLQIASQLVVGTVTAHLHKPGIMSQPARFLRPGITDSCMPHGNEHSFPKPSAFQKISAYLRTQEPEQIHSHVTIHEAAQNPSSTRYITCKAPVTACKTLVAATTRHAGRRKYIRARAVSTGDSNSVTICATRLLASVHGEHTNNCEAAPFTLHHP